MKERLRILMVDDHPFILNAYRRSLERVKPNEYEIITTEGVSGETGYHAIMKSQVVFDIAFLDISIPPFEEQNIESGVDLALLLTQKMPNCKIILLTMHNEKLDFNYLFETIKPAGIIIKNDLDFKELLIVFDTIIEGRTYYSETVLQMIEEQKLER
jgi:DNA-binding NarL/FixJ family response regulator